MTTKEIYNINIDSGVIKKVKYFASVINSNGDSSQNEEKAEMQKGSNGRITKDYQEQRYVIRDQG